MNVFVIFLCVIIGAALIIIRTLNMLLSKEIGIYGSNLVNHIAGIIGSGSIYLAVLLLGMTEPVKMAQMPWYVLLGGILGSFFVILSNYTFSKTSVITSTILILAGQFLCALLIDMFLLNITLKPVNIAGAIIISFAVVFYHSDSEKKAIN